MFGEIVGEVAGGVIRLVGYVLFDGVFEILVRGAGYLICRPFRRGIDPESVIVAFVGILFWTCVAGAGYLIYTHIGAAQPKAPADGPPAAARR